MDGGGDAGRLQKAVITAYGGDGQPGRKRKWLRLFGEFRPSNYMAGRIFERSDCRKG